MNAKITDELYMVACAFEGKIVYFIDESRVELV
jgi:hypothetical protein